MNLYDENLSNNANSIIKNLNLKYKNTIRWLIIFGVVIIVSFIVIFILINTLQDTTEERDKYKNQLLIEKEILSLEYSIGYWLINKPDTLNDSVLYNFLIENNAWYPDILLKQAKIESGNYTSNIFKTNNNLYGMKQVYKRQTTQIGVNNNYGTYSNWCLSVLDRLLWDYYTFKEKPDRIDYLKAISIYAEDTTYLSKLY